MNNFQFLNYLKVDYIDYYVYLDKTFLCDYLKYKNMLNNLIFFFEFLLSYFVEISLD